MLQAGFENIVKTIPQHEKLGCTYNYTMQQSIGKRTRKKNSKFVLLSVMAGNTAKKGLFFI